MFKCTVNSMFFVCDFTLISIAILNETPTTNIAPSHAAKMKKKNSHKKMQSMQSRHMK